MSKRGFALSTDPCRKKSTGVLTDHVSDLLFVTEGSGVRNLTHEGVPAERVHFVGNTMIDSLLACKEKADASTILDDLDFAF